MKYTKTIAIIGGGPSGLMAAEILATAGYAVTIYDRMPSMGRKFLMAGRGGLNLTHSEPLEKFICRYGKAAEWIAPYINDFPPAALREWSETLGQKTFIGSSGRVFPSSMKAAPLLRAWLQRLSQLGVQYKMRHNWQGFEDGALQFSHTEKQKILVKADATLLALGGASWPRLGTDGGWVKILSECGVNITPLRPSNCGFLVNWSDIFSSRFAGSPLKSIALSFKGESARGEVMITSEGIEGGAIYALSALLREAIAAEGITELQIDLRPNMPIDVLVRKLENPRKNQSLSTYLRKAGFSPLAIGLLREAISPEALRTSTPAGLAATIKALPIRLTSTTDIIRAISTAGGINRDALDKNFMLVAKPSIFVAGEMLDWEAPTGGYLLQGCFSTAIAAANGIIAYLR